MEGKSVESIWLSEKMKSSNIAVNDLAKVLNISSNNIRTILGIKRKGVLHYGKITNKTNQLFDKYMHWDIVKDFPNYKLSCSRGLGKKNKAVKKVSSLDLIQEALRNANLAILEINNEIDALNKVVANAQSKIALLFKRKEEIMGVLQGKIAFDAIDVTLFKDDKDSPNFDGNN